MTLGNFMGGIKQRKLTPTERKMAIKMVDTYFKNLKKNRKAEFKKRRMPRLR